MRGRVAESRRESAVCFVCQVKRSLVVVWCGTVLDLPLCQHRSTYHASRRAYIVIDIQLSTLQLQAILLILKLNTYTKLRYYILAYSMLYSWSHTASGATFEQHCSRKQTAVVLFTVNHREEECLFRSLSQAHCRREVPGT